MKYQIIDFPMASEINDELYSIVNNNLSGVVKGGGRRTDTDLHVKNIKCINDLILWIKSIFPSVCYNFVNKYNKEKDQKTGYDINRFFLDACWGIVYNKGEGVTMHNHFPYPISFAYYVNYPENSSPFLIEDETINLKEGQLIMFMGHQYHGVSPSENKVNGRCIISGNISYRN